MMRISTPISAHSAGLVVPKATPQMLACVHKTFDRRWQGLATQYYLSHEYKIKMNRKNLWHHKVPGVDVDTASATNHHNPGKD